MLGECRFMDFLGQVVGILRLKRVAPKPATDERGIDIDQSAPRLGVGPFPQALEQTGGRFGHGPHSRGVVEWWFGSYFICPTVG